MSLFAELRTFEKDTCMRFKAPSGFTLIELMVAVAVVAILAAIAIPSYSAYVTRGQRAAAKAALQQAAQYLERNYTTTGCYNFTVACTGATAVATVLTPSNAPTDGGLYTYALTVTYPTSATVPLGQGFLLAATPCGTAGNCTGGSTFTDSTCGILLLDNTGQKGINVTGSPDYTTAAVTSCWQR